MISLMFSLMFSLMISLPAYRRPPYQTVFPPACSPTCRQTLPWTARRGDRDQVVV